MNKQERADVEILLDALSRGWMTIEQSQAYDRMRAALLAESEQDAAPSGPSSTT